MPKAIECLTERIAQQYIGRKNANAIGIVVKVETLEVFMVPQNIEHMDFVPTLFGTTRDDLIENPLIAERTIPSIITLEYGSNGFEVKSVLTGISGIEIGLGVRHQRADLEIAHKRVLVFIDEGDFARAADFEAVINYKYAKK